MAGGLAFVHLLKFCLIHSHCPLLVWLLIGSVWILPIYSSVIKNNIGLDVSNAVNNVVEQLGDTGIAGPTTAAPMVSQDNSKDKAVNTHNIHKADTTVECDQVLFHFTAIVLAAGWIILAVASAFIL